MTQESAGVPEATTIVPAPANEGAPVATTVPDTRVINALCIICLFLEKIQKSNCQVNVILFFLC